MKCIFKTKMVNDKTYAHNGEVVEVLKTKGIYAKVKFNDGTKATVFISEIKEKIDDEDPETISANENETDENNDDFDCDEDNEYDEEEEDW